MNRIVSTHNIHVRDETPISCTHLISKSRPLGYPLLTIGEPYEDGTAVMIFLTIDHLRQLQDACAAYLAAYDEQERPIPAEAATGATVDTDDLLESMASSYGVRRSVEEIR